MPNNKNEVAVVKSEVMGVDSRNIIVPDFKCVNLGEEPRRLKISVRKQKTKEGKIFNKITGYVKLPVYDGDDYVGTKVKALSVHFRKGAFKTSANVTSPEDDEFKSGYLFVKAKGLRIPSVYRITEKKDEHGEVIYNEDGNAELKYPEIWIESDIIGLQAFVTSQAALDVDEGDDVIDAEVEETNDEEAVSDIEAEELDEEAVSDIEAEELDEEDTTID